MISFKKNFPGAGASGLYGLLLLMVAALAPGRAMAQRLEYGVGLGGSVYKGDLNPGYNPALPLPGIEGFFRYNPSYVTALRAGVLVTGLRGDGTRSPDVYTTTMVPERFSGPLFELSGIFEYNFFDFRDPSQLQVVGSPYLMGGLALYVYQGPTYERSGGSALGVAVPFGVGYKHRITKNLNLSAEFGARKTFTDYIDGTSRTDPQTGVQRGFRYDNDWYAFLSVRLSYVIYTIQCPFDYNAR